jgi:transposase InsO family protein
VHIQDIADTFSFRTSLTVLHVESAVERAAVMSLKMEFVEAASRPRANVAALCRDAGISRQTGYKWLRRFRAGGFEALEEESRRPKSAPLATAEEMVVAIVAARSKYRSWGAKKIHLLLRRQFGDDTPSESTIARVLTRFGQIRKRKARVAANVVERAPHIIAKASNDVWTIDFKGWWRALDGSRCEPLTVRDAFSRFVLTVKLMSMRTENVRAELARLFKKHGIPRAIQCDNGAPFVSVRARGGVSTLSAWWISLGIKIVRSRLASPQDNGAHERMHRDVASDVEASPMASIRLQQRACNRWRQTFNHVRPHEALDGRTPAEVYKPTYVPPRVLPPLYPPSWLVRHVNAQGSIKVSSIAIFVSQALIGHVLGCEPIQAMKFRAWLRDVDLGVIEIPTRAAINAGHRELNRRMKMKVRT